MPPSIAELIDALPVDPQEDRNASEALREFLCASTDRPVPSGRMGRLWILGTLQAKIAAAYIAWWLRGQYATADARDRALNETHLRAALQLLGTMSYLRGAVMKLGQVLANYPNVVPMEFAQVLGRLYFEAPPMHYSLVREQIRGELGATPETVFDDFERDAFAAASLGQVHRARLRRSGRPVAVKVQYPNIARTIQSDMRNMMALSFPMRMAGDWNAIKQQIDDVGRMLRMETDYEQELENLRCARRAFVEADEVVVPRAYPELCSRRVLTMDLLEGDHLPALLRRRAPQHVRDRHAAQIMRASFRLSYHHRLLYADPQPGNYVFLPDGRLGLIDFGCCHRYSDAEYAFVRDVELAYTKRKHTLRRAMLSAMNMTESDPVQAGRVELATEWSNWAWEPLITPGPFDFADAEYFRRGVDLFGRMVRRRYVRSKPVNTWLSRNIFGLRAVLHHMRARVDVHGIWSHETTVR